MHILYSIFRHECHAVLLVSTLRKVYCPHGVLKGRVKGSTIKHLRKLPAVIKGTADLVITEFIL